MSTRDLGTGSLLSTFSVGRTGMVGGAGVGVQSGGGEKRSMTRLRLAPRSLWGPLGPPQSSPFTETDFFYPLSSPSCSVFCFFFVFLLFVYFIFLLGSIMQFLLAVWFLKVYCHIKWTPGSVFAFLFHISIFFGAAGGTSCMPKDQVFS